MTKAVSLALVFLACVECIRSVKVCDGSKTVKWMADNSDCSSFYMCFGSLQHKYVCPKDMVYSQDERTCVKKGSAQDKYVVDGGSLLSGTTKGPLSPEELCRQSNTCVLTYEDSCHKYIDCTLNSIQECSYPLLFDEDSKRCVDPSKAKCGTRPAPKDPCDYDEHQCRSVQGCIPCETRFPSCQGLPNGLNPWLGREDTPYYVVCKDERVVYHDQCDFERKKEIFHSKKRACLPK